MSSVLKILSELGDGKDKALLIELPSDLAKEIKIHHDGSVDTMALLKLLRKVAVAELQEQSDEQDKKIETETDLLERRAFLMNMIFNRDVAVDVRSS